MPLVLASRSQIRREMLSRAGINPEVFSADIDERAIQSEASHLLAKKENLASILAIAKAQFVSSQMPDRFVLGADQTMLQDGNEFHKATTIDQAKTQLLAISGKTHKLNSAAALVRNGELVFSVSDEAQLAVRNIGPDFVDAYLGATGPEILNSLGCYQIEAHGVQLFEKVSGDQFTIMGLPLLKILQALRQQGLIIG